MKQSVLDELLKNKGSFNQLHGIRYHNLAYEAGAACTGDIVELFDSVDGELMAHVCSECGAMRDE
tara:strand:+ start:54 stop:248 length:195 start_codon:yes stop_codon:yes gene_type:complete